MNGKTWGLAGGAGIGGILLLLSHTNPDLVQHWLVMLATVPMAAWGVLSCIAAAWVFPWCVEALVPMTDWGRWQFRATTWGAAIALGVSSAAMLWHSWYVLALWTLALAVQMFREKASETWPCLSPTRQRVVIGLNAAGETTVKIGGDPTLVGRLAPADTTLPGAASPAGPHGDPHG